MSLLKSIFSKPFIEGLGTGLATSTQKGIQDAMDDYDDRIQRIARTRVSKAEEEYKRWNKEFKENQDEIKLLEAQLNQNGSSRGIEVLHSIIAKNGYGYAKTVVPEISSKLVRSGLKIENLYNLPEIKSDGSYVVPTSQQLANNITIPMDFNVGDTDIGTALEGTGMNILNIFSRGRNNALGQAKKYVETELALSGYSPDKVQTDFGELPAPAKPNINVDRFALLLGQSYEKDLGLIEARLETLNPKTNSEEYKRLSERKLELQIIIANSSDKTIVSGSSNERSVNNLLKKYLMDGLGVENTLINGQWQEIDTKLNNSKLSRTYANKLTGFLKMSKLPENRGNLKAPMVGYIDEGASSYIMDEFSKKALPYGEALDAMQFLTYAASNMLDVEVVTREMIKNDSALDRNGDGSPYFIVNGTIDYDVNEFEKTPQNNIVPKNTVSNTGNTSVQNNNQSGVDISSLVTDFLNSGSSTQARKIKVFLKNNLQQTDEATLKEKFKELTGKDWNDTAFGLITK